MSSIDEILSKACFDAVESLGIEVFVNGVSYEAIIDDDIYDDGTGPRKNITLSFTKDVVIFFTENDPVIFRNKKYLIKRIEEENNIDPFRIVELKRA